MAACLAGTSQLQDREDCVGTLTAKRTAGQMDQTNSDLASALRFFKRLACLDGAEKDMCIAAFVRHQTAYGNLMGRCL